MISFNLFFSSNFGGMKRKKKQSTIEIIRSVVAEISGYELGSFDDSAEFERDLGIDTLKIFVLWYHSYTILLTEKFDSNTIFEFVHTKG